jgi:hypothetical protein
MTDQTQTPTTTEEPLGSQDRLDALYRGAWQQWTREHNAKMEIKRLTKEIALLRHELRAAGERNSAFWRGHNILADFIQVTTNMISPRLACRFADYHTWVGDPIHDTCRFCGLKI